MGKYRPIIKTAECKSLTQASQVLGYTQPAWATPSATWKMNWASRYFTGTSEV